MAKNPLLVVNGCAQLTDLTFHRFLGPSPGPKKWVRAVKNYRPPYSSASPSPERQVNSCEFLTKESYEPPFSNTIKWDFELFMPLVLYRGVVGSKFTSKTHKNPILLSGETDDPWHHILHIDAVGGGGWLSPL